jgi:hypothetical protein
LSLSLQSALRSEPVLCPQCKADGVSGDRSDASHAPDLLHGWFHPAAVDAVTAWCAINAAELLQQDVLPITHQELRL